MHTTGPSADSLNQQSALAEPPVQDQPVPNRKPRVDPDNPCNLGFSQKGILVLALQLYFVLFLSTRRGLREPSILCGGDVAMGSECFHLMAASEATLVVWVIIMAAASRATSTTPKGLARVFPVAALRIFMPSQFIQFLLRRSTGQMIPASMRKHALSVTTRTPCTLPTNMHVAPLHACVANSSQEHERPKHRGQRGRHALQRRLLHMSFCSRPGLLMTLSRALTAVFRIRCMLPVHL